jgi:hypothetical protein
MVYAFLGNLHQLSAKPLAIFFKTNVAIILFSAKVTILGKNCHFSSSYGESISKMINLVPEKILLINICIYYFIFLKQPLSIHKP